MYFKLGTNVLSNKILNVCIQKEIFFLLVEKVQSIFKIKNKIASLHFDNLFKYQRKFLNYFRRCTLLRTFLTVMQKYLRLSLIWMCVQCFNAVTTACQWKLSNSHSIRLSAVSFVQPFGKKLCSNTVYENFITLCDTFHMQHFFNPKSQTLIGDDVFFINIASYLMKSLVDSTTQYRQ